MIKISTITPCFKMEKYLKLFLDELPKQTMFDSLQVVLDHNEPTEQEIFWVKDFQSKYPGKLTHIITNPVEPIGVSMNTCIKEAVGEYLCIWNVDDLRTPTSLENQYNTAKAFEADIVHGNFVITNQFGSKKGRFIDHGFYEEDHYELKRGMVYGPFFMFHRSLLDKVIGFDEQLKSGADYDFCMRLARHSKLVKTTKTILGYYLDEGKGASTRNDGRQPTERTVVELRYNLQDKIDTNYLSKTQTYEPNHVIIFGRKIPVEDLI